MFYREILGLAIMPELVILYFSFLSELAASVPRTEVVGKGDYFRFGVRDSLAIEASFLQVRKVPYSECGSLDFFS